MDIRLGEEGGGSHGHMQTCLSDGFPIVFGLRLTESFLKPAKKLFTLVTACPC